MSCLAHLKELFSKLERNCAAVKADPHACLDPELLKSLQADSEELHLLVHWLVNQLNSRLLQDDLDYFSAVKTLAETAMAEGIVFDAHFIELVKQLPASGASRASVQISVWLN